MIYKNSSASLTPNSVAYNNKLILTLQANCFSAYLDWVKLSGSFLGSELSGFVSRLMSAQVLTYFICVMSSSGHAFPKVKEGVQGQAKLTKHI